ncbi:PPE family protein [Mycobacterium sp.]|uniref:PPE family protein n=1 Tax=Mycobacterium sp. TaxID=1785 RepID=UPI0012835571|nr:PPE family protein [Mycobacterium sp.]KAA8964250.1 MAG: PPE family protein [Mycobacterium sp.]
MDFGLLPPEINSGRMYAGPGSGPMLAAAAAWDGLAAQLHHTAAAYESVVSGLTTQWRGRSSATMTAAAAPFTAWLRATAAQAEGTAMQARAAAAAYETAFAATVPPPVVAANRAQLTALIATNFFGQNIPAIMATEAQYAEMWAQDAGAMYGYAGSSATAAHVAPFSSPPRTTGPAGAAGQTIAVAQAVSTASGPHTQALPQVMSAVPQALQSLAAPLSSAASTAPVDPSSPLSALDSFLTGPLAPLSLYGTPGTAELLGVQSYLVSQAGANLTSAAEQVSALPAAAGGGLLQSALGWGTPVMGSAGLSGISAGVGRAGLIGGLSVPQGWASAAPAIQSAAAMLPQSSPVASAALAADGQGGLFGNMALSGLAGRAMVGTGGSASYSAGAGGSAAVGDVATTVNIFVIPEADA